MRRERTGGVNWQKCPLLRGVLGLVLLLCLLLPAAGAESGPVYTTTVLFTHDLHSNFLPHATPEGGELGGYARLATALAEQRARYPDALTVDGGDFSVGSLIQSLYTRSAPELRTMGAMGYDVATLGNHEFDHGALGLAQMLQAAHQSGDPVPQLVVANYKPAEDNPDRLDVQRATATYGVKESILLERGGITYGMFGLMGLDADASAPTSGFTLEDPVEAARRNVKALKEQGAQFIVCLSHSGTHPDEGKSEDVQLAKQVPGIDLIVSGHTHTLLEEPLVVGDTYIVSAGSAAEQLGRITLTWTADGKKVDVDYEQVPIDQSLPEDPEVAGLVEVWKGLVEQTYLAGYGLTYDQVLTHSTFSPQKPQPGEFGGNALGELVTDAFVWAVEQAEGEDYEPITLAVTAAGMLRADLPQGQITTSDAFNVLSLGVGPDGRSGYPLVSCYLTGAELRAIAEVDASVAPWMPQARLYTHGIRYTVNPNRIPLNRVTEVSLVNDHGVALPLEEGKLYRVVSDLYAAQMLGTVEERSWNLLSIRPKDREGNPITDFTQHIITQSNGRELKEWYALAGYLQSMGERGIPQRYAQSSGHKVVAPSWNPIDLLKSPNRVTLAAVLVVVLLVGAVVLLVVRLTRQSGRGRFRRRRW